MTEDEEVLKDLALQEKRLGNALNVSGTSISANEQEYIDEYKSCMEDGGISDKEQRLLSRLAKSLGISKQGIIELEKLCSQPSLSEEENEYITEYLTCYDDGEMSDKEQRLLSRLAKSLGISAARAKELESIALSTN